MWKSLLIMAIAIAIGEALYCDQCSGSQCTNGGQGTCSGSYCLYEYVTDSSGQPTVKRSCLVGPNVVFDDGTPLTTFNQCVTRRTQIKSYIVKVCNNGNYCNRDCNNAIPTNPNIPATSQITCYHCTTTDGTDCSSGTCTGSYCTYQLVRNGASQQLYKNCADTPRIMFNDGSSLTTTNVCDTRAVGNTHYTSQICSTNYCNSACNDNNNPIVNPTARQPAVTCTQCQANNAYDCSGSVKCNGNYCLYERSTGTDGVPQVKRSCALRNDFMYPDGSEVQHVNQCEYKTVNGIQFAVHVCNGGDDCATVCNSSTLSSSFLSILTLAATFLMLKQ